MPIKNLQARDEHTFVFNQEIKVLSDHGYYKSSEKSLEAIGNVVILHQDEALYGESATLNTETGELEITGNVRFTGKDITLYGTKLHFNARTGYLEVFNARIISPLYNLMGSKLIRPKKGIIIGEDTEYTTCRDCPESWSVFGKDIYITEGRYVTVKHAIVKINGVSMMYLPFLMLPIKSVRETGLLFPSLSLRPGEVTFKQPWFWAISNSSDLTATPGMKQRRGILSEWELRTLYGGRSWVNFESQTNNDRVYLPGRDSFEVSGQHYLRHFSVLEEHYQFGRDFVHHLRYSDARDLDILRDSSSYTGDRVMGSELGGGSFFDLRKNIFDISVEGHFNKNTLVANPLDFDHNYVQILPAIKLGFIPFTVWKSGGDYFNYLTGGLDSSWTLFRQDRARKREEGEIIRNARRLRATPYLKLGIANMGPIELKTETKYDYQSYEFPYETARRFHKNYIFQESEISFELDKIFGLSYKENIASSDLKNPPELSKKKLEQNEELLIGDLPAFSNQFSKDVITIEKNSYRHSQAYRMIHHYTALNSTQGNGAFRNQVESLDSGEGLFDEYDKVQTLEYNLDDTQTLTAISPRNSLELKWENLIIKKSAKKIGPMFEQLHLRDNFDYSEIAHLNISQGLELNTNSEKFSDDITRLHVDTGFTLGKTSFTFNDYYFYQSNRHIFSSSLSQGFFIGSFAISLDYANQKKNKKRIGKASGQIQLLDTLSLSGAKTYDFYLRLHKEWWAGITYAPYNKCWKFDLEYHKEQLDSRLAFNFFINFDGQGFYSFQKEGEN
jgi:LPS-assembly protein